MSMGRPIHARNTPEGLRYRVWSTVSDTYVTPVMTLAQVARWLVADAFGSTFRELGYALPDRLSRVQERGTSSRIEGSDLDGPWDACRSTEAPADDDPEDYIDSKFTWVLTSDPWRDVDPVVIDGKNVRVRVKIELVEPTCPDST